MTDAEINSTIAEVCGWYRVVTPSIDGTVPQDYWCHNGEQYILSPDYCTDLNAMHEAEETLSTFERSDFARLLHGKHRGTPFLLVDFDVAHATARQRAEAFLKMKGNLA